MAVLTIARMQKFGNAQIGYENPPNIGAAKITLDGTDSLLHHFKKGSPLITGHIFKYA